MGRRPRTAAAILLLLPLSFHEGCRAGGGSPASGHAEPGAQPAAQATDPVCGMSVDAHEAKFAGRTSRHGGRDYYFCNPECKKAFDADPARYAKNRG
jgi:YHS domain-containing protein